MDTTDMKGTPTHDAPPKNDMTAFTSPTLLRNLVIVVIAGILCFSAIFLGFHLEGQGKWPFDDSNRRTGVVVD